MDKQAARSRQAVIEQAVAAMEKVIERAKAEARAEGMAEGVAAAVRGGVAWGPSAQSRALAKGPASGKPTLKDRDAKIWAALTTRGLTQKQAAAEFGVKQGTVSKAKRRAEALLPTILAATRPEIRAVDPATIEMGERVDQGRKRRLTNMKIKDEND
jgi:hypothetical protein